MSDQATAPAPIEGNFEIIPQDLALPAEEKQSLITSFSPLLARAKELLNESKGITSARLARVSRLQFRKLRGESEDLRKSIKEHHLRMGKAIDGAHAILVAAVAQEEKRMEGIEKEEERKEQARIEAIRQQRHDALLVYGVHESIVTNPALGTMADDAFATLLADSKEMHEARVKREAEEAAEKLRQEVADAQERERVRLENERLLKEAQEREAAAEAERVEAARKQKELEDRLEAERKQAADRLEAERAETKRKQDEADAAAKKKQEEVDVQLAEEKRKREAAEAAQEEQRKQLLENQRRATEAENNRRAEELRRQQEAENLRIQKQREDEEAAEAALLAPDKTKLLNIATTIRATVYPPVKSKKAAAALAKFKVKIDNLADWIEEQAEGL